MDSEYPEPWFQIVDERQRSDLEQELRKEIGDRHPLAGMDVKVVARRDDQDDILVALDNGKNGRIAEVHLTWAGKGAGSDWPRTTIFESMGEWRHIRRKGSSLTTTHS
jgi:hypothetical protein